MAIVARLRDCVRLMEGWSEWNACLAAFLPLGDHWAMHDDAADLGEALALDLVEAAVAAATRDVITRTVMEMWAPVPQSYRNLLGDPPGEDHPLTRQMWPADQHLASYR